MQHVMHSAVGLCYGLMSGRHKPVLYRIETAEWTQLVFGTGAILGLTLSLGQRSIEKYPNSEFSRFSAFFAVYSTSAVANVDLVRPSQVYHTELPPLFATLWS